MPIMLFAGTVCTRANAAPLVYCDWAGSSRHFRWRQIEKMNKSIASLFLFGILLVSSCKQQDPNSAFAIEDPAERQVEDSSTEDESISIDSEEFEMSGNLPEKNEIKEITLRLMEEAQEIEEILHGNHIEFTVPEDFVYGSTEISDAYGLVNDERFHSVADIIQAVECIYSKKIVDKVMQELYPHKDTMPIYKEIDGRLHRNLYVDGVGYLPYQWDTSSFNLIDIAEERITATLGYHDELNNLEGVQEIRVVKEGDVWRLDCRV